MISEIKLAVFDLDDTLLDETKNIPDDAAAALAAAVNKGVLVAPATGRIFPSACEISSRYGFNAPIICYNGAMIRHADAAKPLYVSYVEQALIREIVGFCQQNCLYLQMYDENNNILVEKITAKTLADPDYYNVGCIEVGDFTTVRYFSTPKMMIFDEPKRIAQVNDLLAERYGGRLYLAQSKDYLLEIMNQGVNKGMGLSLLAAELGLTADQVMACGDHCNDLEMVVWAGCGVAVANADPRLKAAANYVSGGKCSEGVAEAVKKFILDK